MDTIHAGESSGKEVQAVCGARLRGKPGQFCQKAPLRGKKRCRLHGGLTPTGYDLPQTTHGKYSKDLPTQLRRRYEEARTDPELLNLRDNIAVLEARISELLTQLQGAPEAKAVTIWTEIQTAMDSQRRLAIAEAKRLEQMGQMIPAQELNNFLIMLDHVLMQKTDNPALVREVWDEIKKIRRNPLG